MSGKIFESVDLGALQMMLYPIISALGGPNVQGYVMGSEEYMRAAADVLLQCSEVLSVAADAVSDGIVTNEEVAAVVRESLDVWEAVEAVKALVAAKGGQ